MIICAFVSSQLVYCDSLYTGLSKSSLDHLQMAQNAAVRPLTKSSEWSHVTPILLSFHWLPIKFTLQFEILVIIFRVLQGQMPVFIFANLYISI